jgi:hypothetical protein
MPLNVSRLADIQRTIPIELDTDDGKVEFNVTYRLSAINAKLSDWIKEHGSDRGAIMGWLERLITKWDITDNGDPVPPTADMMERYGFAGPILQYILDEIYEDASTASLKKSYASVSLAPDPRRSGTRS